MKHANRIAFLLSSLAFIGLSPDAFGNPQSTPGSLPDDLQGVTEVRHPTPLPEPGTEYSMRFVKPSSKYECKIMYVTPDPSINYTIRYVGPKIRNPHMWQNFWHGGKGRREFPRE